MSGWKEKAYKGKTAHTNCNVHSCKYICMYTYTQNHFTFSPSLYTFFFIIASYFASLLLSFMCTAACCPSLFAQN